VPGSACRAVEKLADALFDVIRANRSRVPRRLPSAVRGALWMATGEGVRLTTLVPLPGCRGAPVVRVGDLDVRVHVSHGRRTIRSPLSGTLRSPRSCPPSR